MGARTETVITRAFPEMDCRREHCEEFGYVDLEVYPYSGIDGRLLSSIRWLGSRFDLIFDFFYSHATIRSNGSVL